MEKRKWIDNHIHVSDYNPDGSKREDILPALLEVLDISMADLRFIISCDDPYYTRMTQHENQVFEANRFIYDVVRRAPGRLYGSCMVNPKFLDESLRVMRICFKEWRFVQLGEMLQYVMNYKMNSDNVEKIFRLAARLGVPIQIHISTSNSRTGPSSFGVEQLIDLFGVVERVPEAEYILAHLVGTPKDNPPVVDEYLDVIEKRFGEFPENFWIEIRDFNSPGVRSVLKRVPLNRILTGTDWTTGVGPPFLPYGMIYGIKRVEENPYIPSIDMMVDFLRKAGANHNEIEKIVFQNAAKLFKIS